MEVWEAKQQLSAMTRVCWDVPGEVSVSVGKAVSGAHGLSSAQAGSAAALLWLAGVSPGCAGSWHPGRFIWCTGY